MDLIFITLVLIALHYGHVFTAVALGLLMQSTLTYINMKETKKCSMVTTKVVVDLLGKELAEIKGELELTRDELRRARRG